MSKSGTENLDLPSGLVTSVSNDLTTSPVPFGSGLNLGSGTGPGQHYSQQLSTWLRNETDPVKTVYYMYLTHVLTISHNSRDDTQP
jgi:hypothetical protein